MTFTSRSICSPLNELLAAVEKKIDIEKLEEDLKSKYVEQLKAKDDTIAKLQQEIMNLSEKCKENDQTLEQLDRARKENEVLDEIISDEKRKLVEKQGTVEELNSRIADNLNQIASVEKKNIELKKEVNRLSVMENENQSLNEQVNDLMSKLNRMFELEKKITILSVDCNEKQAKIDNITFELKTNFELNERLARERSELMNRLDLSAKLDSDKSIQINELKVEMGNLNAQLSLQNDKCDFINAKLKDTSALKNQLEKDRKDICWQINDLLKNPDCDFEDLKTFLVKVDEKINNVDFKKPRGGAFLKSIASQTLASSNTN